MRQRLTWMIHYSMGRVAKYSTNMKLQLFAVSRNSEDAAVFSLRIKVDSSGKVLWRQVSTLVYKSSWSAAGIGCFSAFIALAVVDMLTLIESWRLSVWQFDSWWYYFNSLRRTWNWIHLLSLLVNAAWIIWWFVLLFQTEELPLPHDNYSMDQIENNATELTSWLYLGMSAVFLVGLRFSRYSRCHVGLACYYNVFIDAGATMVDFIVFVIYIMVVLCSAIFAFFQINGGNPDFVMFATSLGVMTRISFSQYDWSEFYNHAAGLADGQGWVTTLLFWASVLLLVIFVQNTLISIFLTAFEKNRRKTVQVESTFIVLIFLRIRFLLQYQLPILFRALWLYMFQRRTLYDDAARERELSNGDLVAVDTEAPLKRAESTGVSWEEAIFFSRLAIYDLILRPFRGIEDPESPLHLKQYPNQLRFARWAVARLPEVQALLAFYTDYSNADMVKGHPIWRRLLDFYQSAPNEDGSPGITIDHAKLLNSDNFRGSQRLLSKEHLKTMTGWDGCCSWLKFFKRGGKSKRVKHKLAMLPDPDLPRPVVLNGVELPLDPELETLDERDVSLLELPSLDPRDPFKADANKRKLRSLLRMMMRCTPLIVGGSWWRVIQVLVMMTNPMILAKPRARAHVARAIWDVYKLCERPKIDADGDGQDDRLEFTDFRQEFEAFRMEMRQRQDTEIAALKELLAQQMMQMNDLLSKMQVSNSETLPLAPSLSGLNGKQLKAHSLAGRLDDADG